MKKLLMLIPLLAACAPALNRTPNTVGPFTVGQSYTLSSTSKTDAILPASTTFTVRTIELGDDNTYDLNGISLAGGTRSFVDLYFDPEYGTAIVFDASPRAVDAAKIRLCIFTDTDINKSPYTGFSAHLPIEAATGNADRVKAALEASTATSFREQMGTITQTLAPDDNGSCTLKLNP